MAWSVLQSASATNAGSGNAAVTFSTANLSSGTKVVALVSVSCSSTTFIVTSVKDGAANTWTQLASKISADFSTHVGLYALDTPAGDVGTKPTITATIGTNFGATIQVLEVSGLLAGNTSAMLDGTAGTATGTASPATTSSYSSAAASEFLFLGYGDPGFAVTNTTPGGWTADSHNVSGNSLADCAVYYKNSTGGAESASVTLSGAATWDTILVAFQLASGGGGGGSASALVATALPGKTWRRRFRHIQRRVSPPPPPVTLQVTATLSGSGTLSATLAPYIAGIAGTGASSYFVDQTGKPRLVWGDAVWALMGNAGRWNSGNWQADFDTLCANRAAQGFTVLYGKPIGTTQSGNLDNGGKTFDGLYPFQGGTPSTGVSGANPSTGLTAAFWARIDYFLNSALANGITVFFNAIGYDSDFSSGPGPLFGKSTTEFTAYGTALGTRYASQPNLVWHLADDYFGENDSLITAFMSGVRGAGDTHLVSIENMPESTSRQTLDSTPVTCTWGAANAQYNFTYSYNQEYYGVEQAYAETSPITVIQGDGYFYQGGSTYFSTDDRGFRQAAWWALASGARGKVHGSESIWQWPSTALAASSTDWWYANNALNIRTVVEGLANWQLLLPDTSSALVTAGRGTRASAFASGGGGGQYEPAFTSSYVAASLTAAGDLALLYLPNHTTITVNDTLLTAGYTSTWVDPITGATSTATPGGSAGARTFSSTAKGSNSQSDPDWVLVLQAPTGVTGGATLSGVGSLTASPTLTGAAALSGSGTLTASPVFQATASLSGVGTLSASTAGQGSATLTGLGTLTVSGVTVGTAVTLSGSGTLTASPVLQAAATLSGVGTLSASPALTGAAALSGSGTLTAAPQLQATASLSGSGTLTAAPTAPASAALTGSGTLTAAWKLSVLVPLSGSGTLSVIGGQSGANLSGTGTLTASPALAAAATLSGTGTLTAAPVQTLQAAAGLSGVGSLVPAWRLSIIAALSGAGTLTTIVVPPFTPGFLTAASAATATLGATTAAAATLTASTQRTGGPS